MDERSVLDGIRECSAGYVITHGQSSIHYDGETKLIDCASPNRAQCGDIFGPEISDAKSSIMGMYPWTLPPYNPNDDGRPRVPITIALVDGCDVGADSDYMWSFLYPATNMYSFPFVENQAAVGWNGSVSQVHAAGRVGVFWNTLEDGLTVGEATQLMDDYEHSTQAPYDGHAVVHGDPFTRFRTVYTGDDTVPVSPYWYR